MLTICLFGCSDKTPQLDNESLEKILVDGIKSDIYFDQISNIKIEKIKTTQEDLALLKSTFTDKVPYESYYIEGNISSITMDSYVKYTVLIAYNKEWKNIAVTPIDESTWIYIPKEYVGLTDIMKDLKQVEIEPFKEGYVGNEKTSALTIIKRVEDKDANMETIFGSLKILTDFGEYNIDVSITYYFKKGEWVFGDITLQDKEDWEFTFKENCQIKTLSDKYIKEKLTKRTEFLTYIVNEDYIESEELEQTYVKADAETAGYVYKYAVNYAGIGEVIYDVVVTYKWLSYEWGKGEISVSLVNQTFSQIVGNKYILDEKYISFKSILRDEEKIKKLEEIGAIDPDESDEPTDIKEILVVDYYDGTTVEERYFYVTIELKDNNYSIVDISTKPICDMSLDVNANEIKIANHKYKVFGSSVLPNTKFTCKEDENKTIEIITMDKTKEADTVKFVYINKKEKKEYNLPLVKDDIKYSAKTEDGLTFELYYDKPSFIIFDKFTYYQ